MAENKQRTEKLLQEAKKRFEACQEAEKDIRELALEDLRFRAGEQWPEKIRRDRDADNRPCLTINRLPQFLRQVTNDQRQNRPSISVAPVDDTGDADTAEVLQGIIRHIEYDSNADAAYDTAFQAAATSGFGYFRVVTEYENPLSLNQVIKIKRIRNPFTVYMDPACQEPDYSDARFGFVIETLTRDEFKEAYPDSALAGLDDWKSVGDGDPEWITEGSVRIAEYFFRETKKETLQLLSDGSTRLKGEEAPRIEGVTVVKERDTLVPLIRWVKMNAVDILEETEWRGVWIPIIPVLGDELDVDGKRILEGIVRHAKEPMRQYNYMASAETESIALAPKAPFIVAEGQLEGYETYWQQANVKNFPYLPYKPKTIGAELAPPPHRQSVEPAVQAITQARMQSADDLKATTGIYDSALGARSNETSGVAIQRRQHESDVANFHYIDNLTRAIRHLGRILIDLIPHIYDTPRVLRIIGEDGSQKTTPVNQPTTVNGVQKIYDLTSGRYDVTVTAGPSYSTKRQEAAASMMQLTQAYPTLAQVAGDLMVRNMDWPGSKEIADRLKKMLPPELQDAPDEQQPIPPQAQQAMAQMKQHIQALNEYGKQAEQKISQLEQERQTKAVENEMRMSIEKMKVEAQITMAEITAKSQNERERMRWEHDAWVQLHGSAHEAAMAAQPAMASQSAMAANQVQPAEMMEDQPQM